MVPTDGAHHRQPEPCDVVVFASQATRNPLAAQLCQLLINLDPARSVACVNASSSPPSHFASTLAAHAPGLVISTIGTAHPSAQDDAATQQIALIDACVSAGVPRLLLLPLRAECEDAADANGADGQAWKGVTAVQAQARVLRHLCAVSKPNRGMEAEAGGGGAVEEQEQEQTSSSRKLEWVGIASGTTLDTALLNGQFGVDMKWASAEVVGNGDSSFGASSAAWVHRVAAAVVQHWARLPRNRILHVAGCVTSPAEVLRCLEEVTGQDYLVSFVAVDEAVAEARKRIERGFVDKGVEMLERAFLFDHSRALGAVAAFGDRTAHDLLGLEGESVKDIVGVAVHQFRHLDTAGCGCG
ncbi:hypothetical protein HDK90DRAFT_520974 [Phyllosticta capitalensis]|uniref:Uncharacterized protein n=1 Tax=Phyllosticta capitalensis TaxID=121624 RepID=A0ABR1Z1V1_9PEZI